MKNREKKYRHFDPSTGVMTPFEQIRLLPSDKMFYQCFEEDSFGGFLIEFTGLHDKNGKEIYEGDIINSSYFKLAICVWWNFGWYIKQDGNHFTFNTAKHTIEVIGNIYENPDLLT